MDSATHTTRTDIVRPAPNEGDRTTAIPVTAGPPVVAVMVVYEPGEWFERTLRAMAAQDYSKLRFVLFLAGDEAAMEATRDLITQILPTAFVREATQPDSFGASINEVLRLVEGDSGLFLVCHDDIEPAPDAVSVLVAELVRSHAGVVGPKLVDWDNQRVLQHVGLSVDRLGEVDPLIEPGEVDQEQHDAVRDVFVLPSACMLVRADLFRQLGGFDASISFYGEDLDLCWRAHHSGARVVVVPDAKVAHRERLPLRRPDLSVRGLQSRHRMQAVATLTGGSRLLIRSLQMVIVTIVEMVVGLFTGRLGEALSSFGALIGLLPRTGTIIARRRAIAGQRVVPEREVLGLQVRGSSRLNSFLRGRETTTFVSGDTTVRRWREVGYGPLLAWVVFLAMVVIGSRDFITGHVPPVGEFLPFDSARTLMSWFRSPFDNRGLGATSAAPTSWLWLSVASVTTFFRMGMFETLMIIATVVMGGLGAWRFGSIIPNERGRIAMFTVYVGTPLVPWALGNGELSVLVWWAALPWLVDQLRRTAGLASVDPGIKDDGIVDGVVGVGLEQRVRPVLAGSMILAVAIGFVPASALIWPFVGILLAVATVLAAGRAEVAAWLAGGSLAMTLGGLILNIPWTFSWTWTNLVGVGTGASGRDLLSIATMDSTSVRFGMLAIGLYVPVLAGLALTRSWRLTWDIRGLVLVASFGALAVAKEFGWLSQLLPAAGLLMVPVVFGLGLAAGSLASGLERDVLAQGFGWRQPIAVLANAALLVGLLPAALAVGSGDWHADAFPAASLFESQFKVDNQGEYRVLYVGDPELLPVPGRQLSRGVGFAVVDAGGLSVRDRVLAPSSSGDDVLAESLQLIADGSTLRAGRTLAPLGIRYVVIPESRGVASVSDTKSVLNVGLIESMSKQLDLGRVEAPPTIQVFENQSFIPAAATLTGATAAASKNAGLATLARSDLSAATPVLPGFTTSTEVSGPVTPEVLHLGIPFNRDIRVQVGGADVEGRPSFGIATAFDIGAPGEASVTYGGGTARMLWLLAGLFAWLAALFLLVSPRSVLNLGRARARRSDTLVDLAGEMTFDDVEQFDHVYSDGMEYRAGSDPTRVVARPEDGAPGAGGTAEVPQVSPIDPGMTGQIEMPSGGFFDLEDDSTETDFHDFGDTGRPGGPGDDGGKR